MLDNLSSSKCTLSTSLRASIAFNIKYLKLLSSTFNVCIISSIEMSLTFLLIYKHLIVPSDKSFKLWKVSKYPMKYPTLSSKLATVSKKQSPFFKSDISCKNSLYDFLYISKNIILLVFMFPVFK